jgi:tetratricopeptide (TPR) repeat protein
VADQITQTCKRLIANQTSLNYVSQFCYEKKRHVLKFPARSTRPIAIALLSLLLPIACASDNLDTQYTMNKTVGQVSEGASISGNYLAGRHAQNVSDWSEATMYFGNALELSPVSQSLLQRTFLMMASEGRIGEAIPLAHKVLTQNPKAPVANLAVIVDDIHASHFDGAMKKIAALPAGGLNDYMAPLLAAWTSMAQGQTVEDAVEHLSPLKQDGSKPLYYLHKAFFLDLKGDHDAAVKVYLQGIKEQGSTVFRIVQLLGNLYERKGDTDKAKALYKKFAQVNPRSSLPRQALRLLDAGATPKPIISTAQQGAAESFFGIATSLSQQNAKEMALFFARIGLYLRPDFPVMQTLLGNLLQLDGQLENANAVFLTIDASSAYSWPARLSAAENLNDLERTDEAARTLNAMADEEAELADSLIRLGDIMRVRERFVEARKAYDRAFKRIGILQSHHWTLLYARGIVLERTKQWERAEADFLKALEFNPDQPSVLNYLGYSWVDQGRYLDRAKEMIQKAVNLRPNNGYIVDSLGWAYFRLGEFSNSVKEMERAVELKPEDSVLNDHLGDALWRVGRKLEARFQWNRVLILKPKDGLRIQVVEKLANGLPDVLVKAN